MCPVPDDRDHCSKKSLLGAWADTWLNLLAVAKTYWFIPVSVPAKSPVVTEGVFLQVNGYHLER